MTACADLSSLDAQTHMNEQIPPTCDCLSSPFSGSALAFSAPPAGLSPASILNRSLPTAIVSSSSANNSVIVPAVGALTDTSICRDRLLSA